MCVFRFVPRKCQRAVSGCWLMRTNMQNQNCSAELLSLFVHNEQVRLSLHVYICIYLMSIFLTADCWQMFLPIFPYFSFFLFFPNSLYFRLPIIPASAWMCAFGFHFPCVVREKNGRVSQSSWSGKTRKNNVKAFLFLCCAYVRVCIHLCLWVIDSVFSLRTNYITKIQTNVFLYQPFRLLLANLLFYHFQLMASEICLTEIISYFFNCVQFPLLS